MLPLEAGEPDEAGDTGLLPVILSDAVWVRVDRQGQVINTAAVQEKNITAPNALDRSIPYTVHSTKSPCSFLKCSKAIPIASTNPYQTFLQ